MPESAVFLHSSKFEVHTELCQCINCSNQDLAAAQYAQDDTISPDDDSDYELDEQPI